MNVLNSSGVAMAFSLQKKPWPKISLVLFYFMFGFSWVYGALQYRVYLFYFCKTILGYNYLPQGPEVVQFLSASNKISMYQVGPFQVGQYLITTLCISTQISQVRALHSKINLYLHIKDLNVRKVNTFLLFYLKYIVLPRSYILAK